MKDKKLVFYIALVFIFLATISFTYAYFMVTVEGNNDAKQIVTTTGNLELEYVD